MRQIPENFYEIGSCRCRSNQKKSLGMSQCYTNKEKFTFLCKLGTAQVQKSRFRLYEDCCKKYGFLKRHIYIRLVGLIYEKENNSEASLFLEFLQDIGPSNEHLQLDKYLESLIGSRQNISCQSSERQRTQILLALILLNPTCFLKFDNSFIVQIQAY